MNISIVCGLILAASAYATHEEVILLPGGRVGPQTFSGPVVIRCELDMAKLKEIATACIIKYSKSRKEYKIVQMIPTAGGSIENEVKAGISPGNLKVVVERHLADGTCHKNYPSTCMIQTRKKKVESGIPGVFGSETTYAVVQLIETPNGLVPITAFESGGFDDSRNYTKRKLEDFQAMGICKKTEAPAADDKGKDKKDAKNVPK